MDSAWLIIITGNKYNKMIKFINSKWMRLSILLRPRQITPSSISIILHMIWKPNSTSSSSSCSSYSLNEWSVSHFCFHNQNNSTSSPGLLGWQFITCRRLHFWRHFLVKHKTLPNLVISNWLWGIMRVLLANKNWGTGPGCIKPS